MNRGMMVLSGKESVLGGGVSTIGDSDGSQKQQIFTPSVLNNIDNNKDQTF